MEAFARAVNRQDASALAELRTEEQRFVDALDTVVEGRGAPAENHWSTPVALRAFVENGEVAEWRVYSDNEPLRRLMVRREN